ncbi:MAG: proprotein convertase P-domain-containing protein, partial [Saprospiraceae bacterium]|nr:proprotein convertase P-domain-containing protein [Saprospiraceae bacterium]
MKRKNTLNLCLSALFALFAVSMGMAQTFTGNTTNTAGNMAIPSAGTGGCTVAPQTTGGTFFQNTVAGINAAAVLTSVQINLTHTFDSDLDIYLVAPNGQILELSTDNGGGNDNYTNTVFCDNAASSITAGAAPFTGIFRPEGTLVASACGTTVTPTVTTLAAFAAGQNGIWQLQIKDDVGADAGVMLGWSLSFNVPGCTYAGVTLPTLNIAGTDPAVCGASNVQVTVPAGVGNCASSVVSVFVDGVFLINSTPGGVVTIPLLTSGAHTVQYRLSACDLVNQTINVTDGVPPALLCPSNVTYNLDPGACSQFVNYEIFAVDNCPGLNVSMNQNLGWPQAVDIALVCSNAAADALSYYRVFNVAQNLTATSIDLGVWRATPGSPFTIKLWALTGVLNNANLTNLLSTTVYDPAAIVNAQTINIPLTPTQIPAGTNVVVQITSSGTATPQAGSSVGFDLAGESAPTYAYGCLNTAGVPAQLTADIADLNFFSTRGLILQLNMAAPAVTLTQTAGLPSGSEFPIGTTTNCFTAVDYAGNESECCFDVTVIEYPNPVDHLTCNDLVHFSVDADCSGCIGADDVLEGGPYGCYDDYIVELDKTLPYGNGPWVPACVGPSDIGKTYQVRVTDPENVNNRCWGSVKIEDKLPPVLSCPTVGLPCNADVAPQANQAFTLSRTANFAIPAAGTVNVNFDIPSNTPVLDVNVSLVTDHTWVGDTRMTLTSPSGTTVVVYDRPGIPVPGGLGCAGDGLDVDFDDESNTPYAVFESTCGNGPAIAGEFQPIELLSGFDGESAAGTWVLSVQDLVGGDGGPNSTATISIATQGGAGFPNGLVYNVDVLGGPTNFTVIAGSGTPTIESCSNVSLTFIDTPVQEDCASGLTQTINRKWTATDASGNSTTCIQVIELFRPTLNDVVLPSDYDGIDAQYFQCTDNAYPTPEWIEGQGLQGFPYVFGVPVGCNINWSYTDYEIPVCDGTYKIRREWSVIDWCIGQGFLYNQIIKVVDEEGPAISCPANMTVSVDPFSCCAFVNLPDVIIEDNCSRINNISGMVVTFDPYTGNQTGMHTFGGNVTDFPGNNHWDLDTLGAFGWTPCLPQGTHTVTYIAEDDCGNTSTCSFRLTVRDYVPPVAACDETTTVAIGVDDPFDCYGPAGPNDVPPALGSCEFAGVTWVKATTFDDGSYDHCNGVNFTIRRMAPYSESILGLNATNGFLPCDDIFPDFPSEFERAIAEQDSIKFYCCEVGTTQTIILRVYQ